MWFCYFYYKDKEKSAADHYLSTSRYYAGQKLDTTLFGPLHRDNGK